jgi:predicted amidophosphoribosyltransferase
MATPENQNRRLTPDEVTDFAESVIPRMSPVPKFSGKVPICRFCHGPADPVGVEYCKTCIAWWGLNPEKGPPFKVTPISLFEEWDEFDEWVGQYRSHPANPATQRRAREVLASAIGEFLRHHKDCLLGADYKGPKPNLVTVPSIQHRSGTHPLREVLQKLPPEWAWVEADVLRATPALPHNPPRVPRRLTARQWYEPAGKIRGLKVLVVDDVWETGARQRAAVSALQDAGAQVLGVVVAGRRINPSATVQADRVWKWAREHSFSYKQCCWCSPEPGEYFQRSLGLRFPPVDQ